MLKWQRPKNLNANLAIILILALFIAPIFSRQHNFPFFNYQMYSKLTPSPIKAYLYYGKSNDQQDYAKIPNGSLFFVPFHQVSHFGIAIFPKPSDIIAELEPSKKILREHMLFYNETLSEWPRFGCPTCRPARRYSAVKVDEISLEPVGTPELLTREISRRTVLEVNLDAE